MDIENGIEGIKIVLNTTEFLFCETSIKDIFMNDTNPIAHAVNVISPYSINNYNINNYYDLIVLIYLIMMLFIIMIEG